MPTPSIPSILFAAITMTAVTATAGFDPTMSPTEVTNVATFGTFASVGVIAVGGIATKMPGGEDLGEVVLVAGCVGFLASPSLGHGLAGDIATPGLLLRLAGVGGLVAGYAMVEARTEEEPETYGNTPIVVFVVSASAVLTGTILDLVTTGDAVRAYNRKFELAATTLSTPTGMAGGLALSGRF